MLQTYEVTPEVFVLPTEIPVPGIGRLPANAYLVRGRQPYLVDTGQVLDADAFLAALEALVDLDDLRWIYLTHDDPDHIGALHRLLERAPNATVITTFVAMAKLGLWMRPLPPPRVHLLNPGERLDLGDRVLSAVQPPLYDSPVTTAFFDSRLDAMFSADSFGAPLDAFVPTANELPPQRLAESQRRWASLDSPWMHHVDRAWFERRLRGIAERDPTWIFSSHLPPAEGMATTLCATLTGAPDAPPFAGPTHEEFQALLGGVAAAEQPSAPA